MAAMGKGIGQVLGSAIKATLGFLLIGAGAGLVTASLEPLGVMIEGATGMRGVVPTNEAIAGIAQAEYGSQVAWLMILGFAVSLLLALYAVKLRLLNRPPRVVYGHDVDHHFGHYGV